MQVIYKRIILATDFSDTSKETSYYALQLAQTYKAELKALHVFDTSAWEVSPSYYFNIEPKKSKLDRVLEDTQRIPQREKKALKELAKSYGLDIETIFIEGTAGEEIVHYAEETNADLLVLGTHGYKGWKRFALGSVAAFVVRHAPCAVLTIRHRVKWIKPMSHNIGKTILKEESVGYT